MIDFKMIDIKDTDNKKDIFGSICSLLLIVMVIKYLCEYLYLLLMVLR